MKYTITKTNARAMGNAYKINCNSALSVYVILCDSGVMGITKALKQYHISFTNVSHISNMQADVFQRENVPFFEIKEG